jgi:hypothetical protein
MDYGKADLGKMKTRDYENVLRIYCRPCVLELFTSILSLRLCDDSDHDGPSDGFW